jgi:mannose-6-phosphate isomerase-like protein (cupin superfamily)
MSAGLYAPVAIDNQAAHVRDELYVIVRGCGEFVKNGESVAFDAHDVLFMEAGATHRFEKLLRRLCCMGCVLGPRWRRGRVIALSDALPVIVIP